MDYADVLLPVSPFSETAGTYVNCEGRAQSFAGCVQPLGEARPAWKVLRVLGSMLGIAGFDQDTSEEVRARALGGLDDLERRLVQQPVVVRLEADANALPGHCSAPTP